jgi:hypothetical protein
MWFCVAPVLKPVSVTHLMAEEVAVEAVVDEVEA